MDVSNMMTSFAISKGTHNINLNRKGCSPVERILGSQQGSYLVKFADGSESWVKRDRINPVLTNEFDTRPFVEEFNSGRDTSGGSVYVYIRTSRESRKAASEFDHTDTGTSIEVQKLELCNLAKGDNLKVEKIGMDAGQSAKDMNNLRGLEYLCHQIEEDLEAGTTKGAVYLYVWNVSRFSRNTRQALDLLDHLTDLGVVIFFAGEGVTYDSAAGRHAVRMALSAAQFHSESTSELVQKVVLLKKQKGTFTRKYSERPDAPYGKRWSLSGTLVDNPEELSVISTIKKMYNSTKSATKVVRYLKIKGERLRGKVITEMMVKTLSQDAPPEFVPPRENASTNQRTEPKQVLRRRKNARS